MSVELPVEQWEAYNASLFHAELTNYGNPNEFLERDVHCLASSVNMIEGNVAQSESSLEYFRRIRDTLLRKLGAMLAGSNLHPLASHTAALTAILEIRDTFADFPREIREARLAIREMLQIMIDQTVAALSNKVAKRIKVVTKRKRCNAEIMNQSHQIYAEALLAVSRLMDRIDDLLHTYDAPTQARVRSSLIETAHEELRLLQGSATAF